MRDKQCLIIKWNNYDIPSKSYVNVALTCLLNVYFVYVCVTVYTQMYADGGSRQFFIQKSSMTLLPYSLRQGLSSNPELINIATFTSQVLLGDPMFPPSKTEWQVSHHTHHAFIGVHTIWTLVLLLVLKALLPMNHIPTTPSLIFLDSILCFLI